MQSVPGAGAGDAADKAAALAAADTLVELLDTFGVELPEPKVELPLGLLGVAAGLVAYTGDDVDEAAAKILEARAEARAAKNWDRPTPSVTSSRTWASPLRTLPPAPVSRLSNPCGFPKHPTLPF